MNGHCPKDIVTSIVYTNNHGKNVLIFSLFSEYVCLMELQNTRVIKLSCRLRFFTKLLIFLLFLFNLFLLNDLIKNVKSCVDVILF